MFYKRIVSFVLACIMIIGATVLASADSLSSLQQQQQDLQNEADEYQAIIDDKQGKIDEQEEYVAAITGKVNTVNAEIEVSRSKIAVYDGQIAEKTDKINELNKNAEDNMNLLRERIRALYKAGEVSTLEIILGASDYSDFVDKLQLVESMSDYDAKLIDEIEGQLDVINGEIEKLNADKADLEAENAVLQSKQDELNALLAEHQEVLAKLYNDREDIKALLDSNEASQSEIEQQIQQYYESQRQQNQTNSEPVYGTGNYVWPVPGFYWLSSEYGEDRGYSHGGIDIAGGGIMGAPVVAADSGTVIDTYGGCSHNWGKYGSCGCGGGYGNYVWIDHGNGKASIYAHLSGVNVSVGESVSAGQVIGYVGSTGDSTGAHLHFETRSYGTRYNPMSEF